MQKYSWFILLVAMASGTPDARADAVVTLDFNETTVLNGTAQGAVTGVPLTFETSHEILSIAIDWADTGTANFPYPLVYGAEDNIVLDGVQMSSVCNYLVQTGPSAFQAMDCPTGTLQAPYLYSATYSGAWGSAEIGFAANVPIIANSTFEHQTITPEPGSTGLLGITLVGLVSIVTFRRRASIA